MRNYNNYRFCCLHGLRHFDGIVWKKITGLRVFFTALLVSAAIFCFIGQKSGMLGIVNFFEVKDDSRPTGQAGCPLPYLDPFDPKILPFIHHHQTLSCNDHGVSLVDYVDNNLKIDVDKVKAKLSSGSLLACRYKNVSRKPGKVYENQYGPWSDEFNASITLGHREEFVVIECTDKGKMLSRSFISVARKKQEVEESRVADFVKHLKSHAPTETLNVMMVGIDGMSKENVIRTMPKTKKFIMEELSAIEFKKFNKVAMNTYLNVIPLLTGMHVDELPSYWNDAQPFDVLDHLFLWNHYQKAGYRTAVNFDNMDRSAFHYLKKGWDYPSFDYYTRPIVMESQKYHGNTDSNCMGDVPEIVHLLDYYVQLATMFNATNTPYFAYSFFTTLSHDDQNMAGAGDEFYLNFFMEMKRKNLLNNTVFVLFSDHGLRFGRMRETYNGVLESKLPFVFFIFPPWFEGKYPQLSTTFRRNSDRLMTMFDIHATLEDLLRFTGVKRTVPPGTRGITLFSEIPENRTCKDAGIQEKYCACSTISRDNVASSKVGKILADKQLNTIIQSTDKYRDNCTVLQLNETKKVLAFTPEADLSNKYESMYYVLIQTFPGDGLFEATLVHNSNTNETQIVGDISRLNMYRGQAECIDDHKLRQFCYCIKNPGQTKT